MLGYSNSQGWLRTESAFDTKGMSHKHTYEVLAEVFTNEGVDTCFALLGDANMNWAAALAAQGCGFIYVRDEHCAVAAAMAWSRTTGDVGVATVTCGPGVTQIMTALPAAVRAGIPLIIFAGEAPLSSAWYNQGIGQQALIEACGAVYLPLHDANSMPVRIRDAFVRARTDSQPIVLGVPMDVQETRWNGAASLPQPSARLLPEVSPMPPHPLDVERAVTLILAAPKIVIMAGRGAVDAGAIDACKQLAELTHALLATTLPARGAFHDDPFCIGIAGGFSTDLARQFLKQADLVIAVGCSLAQHNSDSGKLFDADRVLHIDTRPSALGQGRVAARAHLRGDARLSVEALHAVLKNLTPEQVQTRHTKELWRNEAVAMAIQETPADSATYEIEPGLLDPREVVVALDKALPSSCFVVNSSGHCSYFFAQMSGRPVERFLTIREFGAIGNGIAFAIGVAVAHPEQKIILFDGDGSLLMHIQELETIRRHELNIVICVLNDGAYGSEIHKLRAEGLGEEGAVFGRPEFASIAQGFGVEGVLIENLDDLDALVKQFEHSQDAAIWDFHVSDKVMSPVIRRSHHQ